MLINTYKIVLNILIKKEIEFTYYLQLKQSFYCEQGERFNSFSKKADYILRGAGVLFSRGGQISKKGHFFVKKALQQMSIIATMSQSN